MAVALPPLAPFAPLVPDPPVPPVAVALLVTGPPLFVAVIVVAEAACQSLRCRWPPSGLPRCHPWRLLKHSIELEDVVCVRLVEAEPPTPGIPRPLVLPPLPPVAFCVSVIPPLVAPLTTLVSETVAPMPLLPVELVLPPPLPPTPVAKTLTVPPVEEPVTLPASSLTAPPLPLVPLALAVPPLPPVPVKLTVTDPVPPDEPVIDAAVCVTVPPLPALPLTLVPPFPPVAAALFIDTFPVPLLAVPGKPRGATATGRAYPRRWSRCPRRHWPARYRSSPDLSHWWWPRP